MVAPKAVVIYDGRCRFCLRWIDRIRRWDRHGRLEFVPYQSPELDRRFPSLSRADCALAVHLIEEDGTIHKAAVAARGILARLPGGRFWGLPFRLPGALPVAERVYSWITRKWGPVSTEPRAI